MAAAESQESQSLVESFYRRLDNDHNFLIAIWSVELKGLPRQGNISEKFQ